MNLVQMVQALGFNKHPMFGLAMAAALGLEREYPDRPPISDQMNPLGHEVARDMANGCTNAIILDGAWHSALDFARTTSLITNRAAHEVVEVRRGRPRRVRALPEPPPPHHRRHRPSRGLHLAGRPLRGRARPHQLPRAGTMALGCRIGAQRAVRAIDQARLVDFPSRGRGLML